MCIPASVVGLGYVTLDIFICDTGYIPFGILEILGTQKATILPLSSYCAPQHGHRWTEVIFMVTKGLNQRASRAASIPVAQAHLPWQAGALDHQCAGFRMVTSWVCSSLRPAGHGCSMKSTT